MLEEAAEDLVKYLLPPWSQETRISQIVDAMAHFDSYGITSAISARVDPADMRAHQIIARNGAATLRMTRKDINGTVYGAAQAVSREETLRLYTSSDPVRRSADGLRRRIEEYRGGADNRCRTYRVRTR